ncbi:hypothetical protein MCAP1_003154 [Malassezia caprae]|uniref:Secreted protein n=1 Tax=Malassezia caprae TaxID=1381934 RepID=A0AAF0E9P2_9BASI|nr:hypothetical protein MCAP1_003154 [Malassezia caprae]
MRLWLLVLCAAPVWANTALENVGPLLCEGSSHGTGSDFLMGARALHASSVPHRAHLPVAATSEWALYPDMSETWLEKYAPIPQAWRWVLTQRYQLRVSAPANVPADVDLDILKPTASAAGARPCNVIMARITIRPTGVAVAAHGRRHSWLTRVAEFTLGWAAPAMRAPTAVPVDITFEHLYLGVVPATALSMARTMLVVLMLLAIALVPRPRG